jgi:hypothetical protein
MYLFNYAIHFAHYDTRDTCTPAMETLINQHQSRLAIFSQLTQGFQSYLNE